jgi:hypothetical protein
MIFKVSHTKLNDEIIDQLKILVDEIGYVVIKTDNKIDFIDFISKWGSPIELSQYGFPVQGKILKLEPFISKEVKLNGFSFGEIPPHTDIAFLDSPVEYVFIKMNSIDPFGKHYGRNGIVDVFSFSPEDQSAAEHLFSVFVIFDLIRESPFGLGIGFDTGESYMVGIFGQMGVIGLFLFFLIFYKIYKNLKRGYIFSHNKRYFIAGIFLLFNLLGSLISRENYTFIVSYFSWIYIGYMFEMSRKEKVHYENIS